MKGFTKLSRLNRPWLQLPTLYLILFTSSPLIGQEVEAVGFEVMEVLDHSQTHPDHPDTFLPVQLSIWYPAVRSEQEPMTFRNYVLVTRRGHSTVQDESEKIAQFKRYPLSIGAEESRLNALLDRKMMAISKARPEGKWPVILLTGSVQAHYWLPTAESLASQGFVVVAIPSMRHPVDGVANIRLALNTLANKPYADLKNIGLIGYSTGGANAILYQMNNAHVKAVLTLEGSDTQSESMRTSNKLMFEKHPYFDLNQNSSPICVIYSGRGSYGRSTGYSSNFNFYNITSAPYTLVRINNLHHEGGTGLAYFTDIEPHLIANDTSFTFKQDYLIVKEVTAAFFNTYLKNETSFSEALSSIDPQKAFVAPFTEQKAIVMIQDLINRKLMNEASKAIDESLRYYPDSQKLISLKARLD